MQLVLFILFSMGSGVLLALAPLARSAKAACFVGLFLVANLVFGYPDLMRNKGEILQVFVSGLVFNFFAIVVLHTLPALVAYWFTFSVRKRRGQPKGTKPS